MPWWRRWSKQITFDDALGRGVRTLDEARTASDLVGVEYGLDGSMAYVRLTPPARAASPGATFLLRFQV